LVDLIAFEEKETTASLCILFVLLSKRSSILESGISMHFTAMKLIIVGLNTIPNMIKALKPAYDFSSDNKLSA
jgi:hypothetical protein